MSSNYLTTRQSFRQVEVNRLRDDQENKNVGCFVLIDHEFLSENGEECSTNRMESVKLLFKMGNSSEKCMNRALYTSLIIIFVLQLIGAIERQVFDFLGFMWAPIIGNFFTIACTVIGLFGACQYRPKFIIVFTVWSLLWLGWNMFVICLYLEVGVLSRTNNLYILNIGTKNKSWWLEHGVGCRITNTSWLEEGSSVDASRPIPPEEFVEGCMLQYYYVEVIHAAAQCLLSVIGIIISLIAISNLSEEDESSSPANDELEFVKIRYRSPAHHAYRNNIAFEDINQNDFSSLERPPSYDTTMRDTQQETTAANLYYASDRQSLRSKASTRSKRSTRNTHHHTKPDEPRQELPWVQITPSQNTEPQIRHFR